MHPFLVATSFLTRLPVAPRSADAGELRRSLAWFPAVGFVLGLALALAGLSLGDALPSLVTGVALVGGLAVVTGGLHLDGLADTFDALGGSGGDRERALAIMKDPHVGAHGVVALVLVLVAKCALVGEAVDARAWGVLVVFPAVARWCAVWLLARHPYARSRGLGSAFEGDGARSALGPASAATLALVLLVHPKLVLPALLAAGTAATLGAWLTRRLGGLTGDVYGAAIELGEVVFLCAAAVL